MQKNHFLGKLSGLLILSVALVLLGTLLGSVGSSWNFQGSDQTILFDIRLPRSLGAYLAGALLGLAGGIAQSLFRNPLADPYLLGSASGALLGVGSILCFAYLGNSWLEIIGLNGDAFLGALIGVVASLVLAGGYRSSLRLLLSGVVISVILGAANSLFTFIRPDLFQSIQSFMLGNTTLLNWTGVEMIDRRKRVVGNLAHIRLVDRQAVTPRHRRDIAAQLIAIDVCPACGTSAATKEFTT